MDSLNWLNGAGEVSMSFTLRVAVLVLFILRDSLAYKVIRRGLLIWKDYQVLYSEDGRGGGVEPGKVVVLV